MEAETKSKTLHYRRATFLQKDQNLQKLLAEALSGKLAVVGNRFEPLSGDESTHRFVNTNRAQMGMLFGSLIVYSEGTHKALVTIDKSKKELKLEQIAPPEKGGKKREFLDSILYFGIKDNHVLLLQSAALRSRHCEAHMNWLLNESKVFKKEDGLFLEDCPSSVTKKKIENSHVKKVKIGTPLEAEPTTEGDEVPIEETKRVSFKPKGLGFGFLQQALGENWISGLNLNDSLDDSRLEVFLEIKYTYSTSKKGQKLLDKIANSLRHIEEQDINIELKNGARITGKDIKLSGPVTVQTHNGIIDESQLFPEMHKWLLERLDQGIIDT